ncbi:SH3 domain-containing protein [Spironucleus salmonicida]|uniref:SH3 domain-containing protein n=1 Tax=Spironucleus salmonicida TaxID=348837 RepID=V6LP14_9EUKA|nr:SH3 domain-containing protein [Spironucleus salmonicida]|eukprot:EST45983.1 SH3 domain-containing protein [Spironucleus salmonicida]
MSKSIETRITIKDYKKERDDMIEIIKGDNINVISHTEKGWSMGKNLRTGLQGWFPLAFTQELEQEDEYYYYSDEDQEDLKAQPKRPQKPVRNPQQQGQTAKQSKDQLLQKIEGSKLLQAKIIKEIDMLSKTETIDLPFQLTNDQSLFVVQEENQLLKQQLHSLDQEININQSAIQAIQQDQVDVIDCTLISQNLDEKSQQNLSCLKQLLVNYNELKIRQDKISGQNLVAEEYLTLVSLQKLKKGLEKELELLNHLKISTEIEGFLAGAL